MTNINNYEKLTLKILTEKLSGELVNAAGLEDSEIKGISTLEKAEPGEISFISNQKFLSKAEESKASYIIVPEGMAVNNKPSIRFKEIWKAIVFLMNYFYPEDEPSAEVHPTAIVEENVKLGSNVSVAPYAVISKNSVVGDNTIIGAYTFIGRNAKIGANCLIHPRVTIMKDSIIGNRVILHPGSVIGSDGFKYEQIGGRIAKIPQVGNVILEDEVEIGANTTIDRASLTETRIGAFTKIDNLVQIAHNVVIGKGCLIVAQVGVAGSTKIGDMCILAGQAGIGDNVNICSGVTLGARSAVANDIKKPGQYLGTPAIPARDAMKVLMSQQFLPETIKKVRELAALAEQIKNSAK